jgi:capsular polysaccharide export protein
MVFRKVLHSLRQLRMNYYARRFLAENYKQRINFPIQIDQAFPSKRLGKRVHLLVEREDLYGRAFFIESLGADVIRGVPPDIRDDDIALCFGYSALLQHAEELYRKDFKNVLFIEAGFLRSVHLDNSGSIYDQAICFFVDDLGFHFDSTVPIRLEVMMNDRSLELSQAELMRARALRQKIVETRLTKYNDQPLTLPLGEKRTKRVLVIEQARNDWAVVKSKGSRRSFDSLLQAALDENPTAEILVKVHPDSLDGKRGGMGRSYYGRLKGGGRITIIKEKVNPFVLLESVDEVYVFSSMLGFEAALMGKPVHVFGRPCYAGWGFTRDRQTFPRRTRHRSLDEAVFFIYFAYQKYKNLQGEWCSPEDAVDILLSLRERFAAERG